MAKGELGHAEFCPWCGGRALTRDNYGGDNAHEGPSFICNHCFRGFKLKNSTRVSFAKEMFKRDRKLRPPAVPTGPTTLGCIDFPTLNSPVASLSGVQLTAEDFDNALRAIRDNAPGPIDDPTR